MQHQRRDKLICMYKRISHPSPQEEAIAHIEPFRHDLLTTDFVLHANMEARTLSLIYKRQPPILIQQQFTKNEWTLLAVLLTSYPHYSSHEFLLSSITSLPVDECRSRLDEAQLLGADMLRRELKPVYRALCSIRGKLTKLHPNLRVSLIRNVGYVLTFSPLEDIAS